MGEQLHRNEGILYSMKGISKAILEDVWGIGTGLGKPQKEMGRKVNWNKTLLLSKATVAIIIGVFWLLFALSEPSYIAATTLDAPITDMHVHIAGLGYGDSGIVINERVKQSYKRYIYLKAFGVSEEDLENHGDTFVLKEISRLVSEAQIIDSAVVLAMDGMVDSNGELDLQSTEIYIPNDFLIRELPKYPNLLLGASVNPLRNDAIARLEKVIAHGAVLIKWIPNIMKIDPSDRRIEPFYRSLVAHGIPLLTHTGAEAAFTTSYNHLGDPKLLEYPLSLGVTIMAAHVATTGEIEGQGQFERILPLFKKYPNLYADISSLTQINKRGYLQKSIGGGH